MAVRDFPASKTPFHPSDERPLNTENRARALEAFLSQLPTLLQIARNYWVAYHGSERLAIAYDDVRLIKRFALPPEGSLSLWDRIFHNRRVRYPIKDLSLFYITETSLDYEFDVDSDDCEANDADHRHGALKTPIVHNE